MPHYANGRKARILDVVRGRNHTFKHEIVGVLIHINSQSEKCNGIVACVGGAGNFYLPTSSGVEYRANEDRSGLEPTNPNGQPPSGIMATNAYADLDQLVALDVNTGEVLEVEEAEVAEPEPEPVPEPSPEPAPEPVPENPPTEPATGQATETPADLVPEHVPVPATDPTPDIVVEHGTTDAGTDADSDPNPTPTPEQPITAE